MLNMQNFFRPALKCFLALWILLGIAPLSFAKDMQPARTALLEKSLKLPSQNVKVNVIHMMFPVGYKTSVHTHKGPGPRYVLEGTVKITEGGKTKTYQEDEVFWETGAPMIVENVGNVGAELLIFEIVPD